MGSKILFSSTRKEGKNLIPLTQHAVAKDTYVCVEELVTNPYNWGATKVWIDYDKSQDHFEIRDNGYGMWKEGVDAFLRVGESLIANEETDPLTGRRRLGGRGVATLCIGALAQHVQVKTTQRGKGIYAYFEDLEANKPQSDQNFDIQELQGAKKGEQGTTLTMSGLLFNPRGHEGKKQLSMEKLRKKLAFSLPLTGEHPDEEPEHPFRVYLQGKIIEPFEVKNYARGASLEGQDNLLGRYKCDMFLTDRSRGHEGLYIKVFGRAIGQPGQLLSTLVGHSKLLRTLTCVVEADGVDPAIIFDRTSFDTSHPRYIRLIECLKGLSTQLSSELYHRSNTRKPVQLSNSSKESAASKAWDVGPGFKPPKISGVEDLPVAKHIPGIITEQGEIKINAASPMLVPRPRLSSLAYAEAIRHMSVIVTVMGNEDPKTMTVDQFLKLYANWWEERVVGYVADTSLIIHPNADYTVPEIANHLGITAASVNYLIEQGTLPKTAQRSRVEVQGQYVTGLENTIKLYVPFPDLLGQKTDYLIEKNHGILSDLIEKSVPYAKKLGTGAAIGIHKLAEQGMKNILNNYDIENNPAGRSLAKIEAMRLGSHELTLLNIVKSLRIEASEVITAIGGAGIQAQDKTKYLLGDLINVDFFPQ